MPELTFPNLKRYDTSKIQHKAQDVIVWRGIVLCEMDTGLKNIHDVLNKESWSPSDFLQEAPLPLEEEDSSDDEQVNKAINHEVESHTLVELSGSNRESDAFSEGKESLISSYDEGSAIKEDILRYDWDSRLGCYVLSPRCETSCPSTPSLAASPGPSSDNLIATEDDQGVLQTPSPCTSLPRTLRAPHTDYASSVTEQPGRKRKAPKGDELGPSKRKRARIESESTGRGLS